MTIRSMLITIALSCGVANISLATPTSEGEILVAKSKNGDVWIWEIPSSKFDLSRLEIRRQNGQVERHVGFAPLLAGYTVASPRPSAGPDGKIADFPMTGNYTSKNHGADKRYATIEMRCARRCTAVEK